MQICACSKINLYLAVTGKRPNGYHELDTLFYPLSSPADELELALAESLPPGTIEIHCSTRGVPSDPEKNLCGRAALLYFSTAEYPQFPALAMTITKHIPVAAGMGGGSSDAASVLRFLQSQFHLLSEERLAEVALSLGADVPFFLNPVASRAQGVGEILSPVPLIPRDLPIVIAAPCFPVSAVWGYRHLDYQKAVARPVQMDELIAALQKRDLAAVASLMRNDLEDALYLKFPLLSLIRERLTSLGALRVMVSGSGPTLFALFPDDESADSAVRLSACSPMETCGVQLIRGLAR